MSRSRASTLQGPPLPTILDPLKVTVEPETDDGHHGDIFASKEDEDGAQQESGVPDSFEELPIEIRSLTERYGLRQRMKQRNALTS